MLVLTLRTHIMIFRGMNGTLSSKIPSRNESHTWKEKMMKWVLQAIVKDRY